MSTNKMPWFRMYTDSVDDEKLRLIAASDRWYYIAILCCKGKGIIDDGGALLKRKVAVKLGLQVDELEEVLRRLAEVGLIDRDTLEPLGWEGRQFKSDSDSTAAERKRNQRERARLTAQGSEGDVTEGHGHVTRDTKRDTDRDVTNVTRTDTEADTDTEEEQNKNTTHTRKRGAGASDGDEVAKPLGEKDLNAEGVDRQHAKDWLTIRKAKRLPLTPTAWAEVKLEAEKVGMTPQQAVECAVKSGWAGFKGSWVQNAGDSRAAGGMPPSAHSGLETRNYGSGGKL